MKPHKEIIDCGSIDLSFWFHENSTNPRKDKKIQFAKNQRIHWCASIVNLSTYVVDITWSLNNYSYLKHSLTTVLMSRQNESLFTFVIEIFPLLLGRSINSHCTERWSTNHERDLNEMGNEPPGTVSRKSNFPGSQANFHFYFDQIKIC